MKIELPPEDEKAIQERLRDRTFQNAEEVIHDALASQAAEVVWLREHREMIDDKIRRGLDQLDRGQGIPGDAARNRLQQRKNDWQEKHGRE